MAAKEHKELREINLFFALQSVGILSVREEFLPKGPHAMSATIATEKTKSSHKVHKVHKVKDGKKTF